MPHPILTPCQLAAELVDVADRCAPSLPKEARAILTMAARVYRETGEPARAIQCAEAAARIREETVPPRSRPFVPRTEEEFRLTPLGRAVADRLTHEAHVPSHVLRHRRQP